MKSYQLKYTGHESIAYIEKLQKALDELRYHMNYYNSKKDKQAKKTNLVDLNILHIMFINESNNK